MFRRHKPVWLLLFVAMLIIAAWAALFRHQAVSIECATGATEYC